MPHIDRQASTRTLPLNPRHPDQKPAAASDPISRDSQCGQPIPLSTTGAKRCDRCRPGRQLARLRALPAGMAVGRAPAPPAGLADERFRVMIQVQAGTGLAGQPLVPGSPGAPVVEDQFRGIQLDADPAADQSDWHGVAVVADHDLDELAGGRGGHRPVSNGSSGCGRGGSRSTAKNSRRSAPGGRSSRPRHRHRTSRASR
jgi:hypothetical protein